MTPVTTAFVARATAGGRLFALGMLLGPLATAAACAATAAVGPGVGIDLRFPPGLPSQQETSLALRIIASLTVLALLPSILVCLSTFLRIIIVLSMLRQAIGMTWHPLLLSGEADPLFHFVHGFAALSSDRFDEAIAAFERGIARNTGNAPLNDDMRMVVENIRALAPGRHADAPAEDAGDGPVAHVLLSNYGHGQPG